QCVRPDCPRGRYRRHPGGDGPLRTAGVRDPGGEIAWGVRPFARRPSRGGTLRYARIPDGIEGIPAVVAGAATPAGTPAVRGRLRLRDRPQARLGHARRRYAAGHAPRYGRAGPTRGPRGRRVPGRCRTARAESEPPAGDYRGVWPHATDQLEWGSRSLAAAEHA